MSAGVSIAQMKSIRIEHHWFGHLLLWFHYISACILYWSTLLDWMLCYIPCLEASWDTATMPPVVLLSLQWSATHLYISISFSHTMHFLYTGLGESCSPSNIYNALDFLFTSENKCYFNLSSLLTFCSTCNSLMMKTAVSIAHEVSRLYE